MPSILETHDATLKDNAHPIANRRQLIQIMRADKDADAGVSQLPQSGKEVILRGEVQTSRPHVNTKREEHRLARKAKYTGSTPWPLMG